MLEFKARTKKWGNSVGLVLPKKLGIPEGKELVVFVEPARNVTHVKDIFGKFKFKQDVASLMKEIDKELDFGV